MNERKEIKRKEERRESKQARLTERQEQKARHVVITQYVYLFAVCTRQVVANRCHGHFLFLAADSSRIATRSIRNAYLKAGERGGHSALYFLLLTFKDQLGNFVLSTQ
jgi:hypothetical protein